MRHVPVRSFCGLKKSVFDFFVGVTLALSATFGIPTVALSYQAPPAQNDTADTASAAEEKPDQEIADGAYFRQYNLDLQARLFGLSEDKAGTMVLDTEIDGPGTYTGGIGSMGFKFEVAASRKIDYADPVYGIAPSNYGVFQAGKYAHSLVIGQFTNAASNDMIICLAFGVTSPTGERHSLMLALGDMKAPVAGAVSQANPGSSTYNAAACAALHQACQDSYGGCMDTVVATLGLCLAAILGCALLGTAAIWACLLTGVLCIGLTWVGWICGSATVAILKGCIAAAAAAMLVCGATLAVCKARANDNPVCGGSGVFPY